MKLLKELHEAVRPGTYLGPKEFGANPEHGYGPYGRNRLQSMKSSKERLTAAKKAEIKELFKDYDIEIKKIDKTRKGYFRIWYNGSLHQPYKNLHEAARGYSWTFIEDDDDGFYGAPLTSEQAEDLKEIFGLVPDGDRVWAHHKDPVLLMKTGVNKYVVHVPSEKWTDIVDAEAYNMR